MSVDGRLHQKIFAGVVDSQTGRQNVQGPVFWLLAVTHFGDVVDGRDVVSERIFSRLESRLFSKTFYPLVNTNGKENLPKQAVGSSRFKSPEEGLVCRNLQMVGLLLDNGLADPNQHFKTDHLVILVLGA